MKNDIINVAKATVSWNSPVIAIKYTDPAVPTIVEALADKNPTVLEFVDETSRNICGLKITVDLDLVDVPNIRKLIENQLGLNKRPSYLPGLWYIIDMDAYVTAFGNGDNGLKDYDPDTAPLLGSTWATRGMPTFLLKTTYNYVGGSYAVHVLDDGRIGVTYNRCFLIFKGWDETIKWMSHPIRSGELKHLLAAIPSSKLGLITVPC